MTQTFEIKYHGWHKVSLNGNLLTGDTFKISDFIKKYLGGKWSSERKGWEINLTELSKYQTESGNVMVN
jgi:hypothetical protein